MNFDFRRLKLSVALTLLVLFPLLITFTLGVFIFLKNPDTAREHPVMLALTVVLVFAYIIPAILFIQKLAKGVNDIKNISGHFAAGKFSATHNVNGHPETVAIGLSLRELQDDVIRQTKFAEQITAGTLDTGYTPRHEHDALGHALIQIKDNLIAIKEEDQQRNWASDGLAKFVSVLQSDKSLKEISSDIIVNLVRIIQANQGAIYILVKEKEEEAFLDLFACYAYNRSKHLTQRIALGEGMIGQVFLENQTLYLRDVPDQFVRITSGLGEANPRHILMVPLKMNETTVGIIELASFREFKKHEIAFVEKIGESIAYTVSSIRTAENTQHMLDEMHQQAEHMRAQEEELRQNQEELQATQEEISRKYNVLFKQLGELNYQSKFDQLRSINSTKKRNIEYYFGIIRSQILTFSEDRMIVDAMNAFRSSFYQMGTALTNDERDLHLKSLADYYTAEFIPRLNDNTNQGAQTGQYMPTGIRACHLQYLYISDNPHPTGKKSLLDDAGDGSEYSRHHQYYHPIIRNFLEQFGYYDIFLIDATTGDMVYSVFKEVDFGTSLLDGLYHNTNFGKVVKNAMKSTSKDFVQLIDFEPYDPSYHAPASFIACPVFDGETKTGILVFQMPINKINQILTGNNKWREDGLGESGETFMLGGDYKLRSISRELIEHPSRHLDALRRLKYDDTVIQQISKMETSILLEEVRQDSATKALGGHTGTQLERNSLGTDTLSAYAPLDIPDVHWVIMSTMKEEEASERINNLRELST